MQLAVAVIASVIPSLRIRGQEFKGNGCDVKAEHPKLGARHGQRKKISSRALGKGHVVNAARPGGVMQIYLQNALYRSGAQPHRAITELIV